MPSNYQRSTDGASSPGFEAITAHDSTNFGAPCRGIYVGTGGNVAVVGLDAVAVTFTNVPSGAILPVQAIRVNSTNTTASNMVALK